ADPAQLGLASRVVPAWGQPADAGPASSGAPVNPISVDSVAEFIGRMAASVANQLGTDVGVRSFVAKLGWNELPTVPAVFDDLHQSAALIAQAVGELTLARLENDPTKIALAVGKVTAGVTALVSDIDGLPGALESQLPKTYRDATGIATRLGPRMVDLLLID